jgi:hypothetical protein
MKNSESAKDKCLFISEETVYSLHFGRGWQYGLQVTLIVGHDNMTLCWHQVTL